MLVFCKSTYTLTIRLDQNKCLYQCRMDDVEDNSELRRGLPVAHTIYGVPQTINAANYVYFLAFQELLQLRSGVMGKGKDKDVDLVAAVNGQWW